MNNKAQSVPHSSTVFSVVRRFSHLPFLRDFAYNYYSMHEQSDQYTHSFEGTSHQLDGTNAWPPADSTIVTVDRASKRFGSVPALRNVSLKIDRGDIFGLLGPNGAGKSTLLKLLLGFLQPDEGTIKLFGSDNLTRAHARIGYLPERATFHGNFSGREYLQFHARLLGTGAKDAHRLADRALEVSGLHDAGGRRIRTYSKGMRQRLGLAVALITPGDAPPELLILDEPASGLDPEGQVGVREAILDCKRRGSTVLLCSHQLTEVERICSRVGVLRAGRLVVQTHLDSNPRVNIVGTPREGALDITFHLIEYLKKLHPEVTTSGGTGENEPLIVSLPTGPSVPRSAAMKAAALRAMIDAQWDITSVFIEKKDLESLYLQAIRQPIKIAGKGLNGATPPAGTGTNSAEGSRITGPLAELVEGSETDNHREEAPVSVERAGTEEE